MSVSPHRAAVALAIALALASSSTLAARQQPCAGRFLVHGAQLVTDAAITGAIGEVTISAMQRPPTIALSGCDAVRAKLTATRRGTRVVARWSPGSCSAVTRKVRLKGRIDAACGVFTGTLRHQRVRQPVRAEVSRCGDGLVDSNGGEACDTSAEAGDSQCPRACAPPGAPDQCQCSGPPQSTTTTTLPGCPGLLCGGTCIDPQTDSVHCGACDHACVATCASGVCTASVAGIAVSGFHTCALTVDGRVRCWGYNGSGQLGDGTTDVSSVPRPYVSGVSNATKVVTGDLHTCGLLDDGTARCWGYNQFGQLGDGTTLSTQSGPPTAVSSLTGIVGLTGGSGYTCAWLDDGTARCWGTNESGQLGDGTNVDRSGPTAVQGLGGVVQVAASSVFRGGHTCALLADGTARCWGRNDHEQLGDGTTTNRSVPVPVEGLTGIAELAVGHSHTCARLTDGTAYCWGADSMPVPVTGLEKVAQLAAGYFHTCARLTGGTVRCWGFNDYGQLGDGTTIDRPLPTDVPGLTDVVEIAAGLSGTCARSADGTVRCWGRNLEGQLGDGRPFHRPSPVPVANLTDVIGLFAASQNTFAVLANGSVHGWGANFSGQLDDTRQEESLPMLLSAPTGVVQVAGGDSHVCARQTGGALTCWGDNSRGQLGDGTTGTERPLPRMPVPGLTGVASVTAHRYQTCAALTDGTARCWGENTYGQLGDGTMVNRSTPTPVVTLTGVAGVGSGGSHGCAWLTDGTVRCWGGNYGGQLGDGTTTDSPSPVLVPGLGGVTALAAGDAHTCALVAGIVHCWGDNGAGQLGDGSDVEFRSAPGPVPELTQVTELVAGAYHTCARISGGGVRCWGYNHFGQLGDGTTTDRRVPTPVPGLDDVVSLTATWGHTCARSSDGTARCWGASSAGQLGDGAPIRRLIPNPVVW